MTNTLSLDEAGAMPKVVLHDHLDGGLRPSTLTELAKDAGVELPTYDPDEMRDLITRGANSGSLLEYLKPFAYTGAVMQTPAQLARVAAEAVEDLAADGVIYAESRFAPGLHTGKGLTQREVVEAVLDGFQQGAQRAASLGNPIEVRGIVCGLRQWDPDQVFTAAEVARDFYNKNTGIVGFDIAGPEAGFPPSLHGAAFSILREAEVPVTIHAGEADGVESVRDALNNGARRLGHGVRITEDITITDDAPVFGAVAERVRREAVHLETCPCSNVQTGAVSALEEHPLPKLLEWGFSVGINTDNRLMSDTSMSAEFAAVSNSLGFTSDQLQRATRNALEAAFVDEATRAQLRDRLTA